MKNQEVINSLLEELKSIKATYIFSRNRPALDDRIVAIKTSLKIIRSV